MKKYIAIFKYSLKTQFTFIIDYLISLCAFSIHVFIFNELWDYILQGKTVVGYTKEELIWYIIIAECITYSNISSYKKIGQMVKQGDIANMLIKPVDMISYFIAEGSSIIIKCLINIVWAIILGFAFAGPLNISAIGIVVSLISLFIGVFMGIILQIFTGILAFYIEENQSCWLIFQKLSFFAVFTPIEFYPEIVQKLLYFLPTTQMIYAPAKIFTDFSANLAIKCLSIQILSGIMLYLLLRLSYKKGVERINVNGG